MITEIRKQIKNVERRRERERQSIELKYAKCSTAIRKEIKNK